MYRLKYTRNSGKVVSIYSSRMSFTYNNDLFDIVEVDNLPNKTQDECYYCENGVVVVKPDKAKKIAQLKKKLSSSDYKAIKYFEGLMTTEEYAPYKELRKQWRAEINRLEKE